MQAAELLAALADWAKTGGLRPLDLAFTRFIHQQAPEQDPAVLLAIALTCARSGHGHVCLDLAEALASGDWSNQPEVYRSAIFPLLTRLQALDLNAWAERLAASPAVEDRRGVQPLPPPEDETGIAIAEVRPLVLGGTPEHPLLYLRRYWLYEQQILAGIRQRLAQPLNLDQDLLRTWLDRLFVDDPPDVLPWQRIACALAARSSFAVITGGPGTGKTTTVARLLILLQGLAYASGRPPLSVRLAAPTGKAAARLNEALTASIYRLLSTLWPDKESWANQIPTEAQTLHRLLGARPDSSRLRYDRQHPLPADVVIVDEASMIDVERLAALLDALRPEARLILIGDKDQLASVEAGAVLGDLCQRAPEGHYTPQTRAWLEQVTGVRLPDALIDPHGQPLDQAIAMLRASFRFSAEGGIGALAELVRNGGQIAANPDAAPRPSAPLAALEDLFAQAQGTPHSQGMIRHIRLRDPQDHRLEELAYAGYWQGLGADGRPKPRWRAGDPSAPSGYLAIIQYLRPPPDAEPAAFANWARAVLRAQAHFQLLTPLRHGPWGTEGLNQRIQRMLAQHLPPLAGSAQYLWFEGRPVMVTRNDYVLGLMNGDIGITLRIPEGLNLSCPAATHPAGQIEGTYCTQPMSEQPQLGGLLRVAFLSSSGSGIRWISPSRLQAVETVFAMTVHKSQGSEFEHVALVLPDTDTPLLTRELLYTGITRARSSLTLIDCQDEILAKTLQRRVQRISGLALALEPRSDR